MASASSIRVALALATLMVVSCSGGANLGGACATGGRRSTLSGTAGTSDEHGGSSDTDGAVVEGGGAGGGSSLDASIADASGSGGVSGAATTEAGSAGGDSSSGGTSASGGASAGGTTPDASKASDATVGNGGAFSASCLDSVKDDDETDVDCGGSCPPCDLDRTCLQTSDCSATGAGCDVALGGCVCDARSHVCVASHCVDHARDATETDVDCGGLCDGCAPNEKCRADTDCSVYEYGCVRCMCDQSTSTCVRDHCLDDRADVDETDVDCGGSKCSACPNGDLCRLDTDCVSNACDLATHRCVTDQCKDNRQDGAETDADCGGGVCPLCPVGERCASNFDCTPGHPCNGIHICQ